VGAMWRPCGGHVCGARRTWMRGLEKMNKRYSMVVAAQNLGLVMRKLFGSGKPQQSAVSRVFTCLLLRICRCVSTPYYVMLEVDRGLSRYRAKHQQHIMHVGRPVNPCFSTGC
jgi:hypothetical protein